MADYAGFAVKMNQDPAWEARVRGVLEKLSVEQAIFATEADPLCGLLEAWLDEPGNPGRDVLPGELCKELGQIAIRQGTEWRLAGNPRALGKRIGAMKTALEKLFTITERSARARQRYYSFRLKEQAAQVPTNQSPSSEDDDSWYATH
jgi:hypothetical protein